MTKIKLCGLSRRCDIECVNELCPDYIGFVFAKKSKRYVSPEKAKELKFLLSPDIKAVGVFVDEPIENIVKLLSDNIIDLAQLHGSEDEEYIARLKALTDKPVIKAFRIKSENDITSAKNCKADFILLDSGAGTGRSFNWNLLENIDRPIYQTYEEFDFTPQYLNSMFKKYTGYSISEYKAKFNYKAGNPLYTI